MADQVEFELVSPERLLLSRPVDMVVVPGGDGDCDDMPEASFYMVGNLEEAKDKAKRMAAEAA